MVYRDPDTGQYVSGDDSPARYTDYEFQHISTAYTVNAADLPGAFPIEEIDIRSVKMDDLLHRDERADLVAVQIHSVQASVPGTTSAEAALYTRWELGIGNGSNHITQQDKNVRDTDQGASGVVNIGGWSSDDPNTLFTAGWVAEGGFADSTNGLGGGPDAPVLDQDIHFPRDFGACPRLDDRDEITESFQLDDRGSADISDSLIQLNVDYTLVFAVHEEAR